MNLFINFHNAKEKVYFKEQFQEVKYSLSRGYLSQMSSTKADRDTGPMSTYSRMEQQDRQQEYSGASSSQDINAPELPEGIESNKVLKKYSHRAMKLTEQQTLREIKWDHIKAFDPEREKKTLVDHEPTYRQIHETYEIFCQTFPHKDIFKIVKILRQNLIHHKHKSKERDLYFNDISEENKNDTNISVEKAGIDGKTEPKMWQELREDTPLAKKKLPYRKYYTRDLVRQKRFHNKEEEYKYRQKMMVAKAFYNKEYGLASLQAELAESQNFIIIKRCKYCALAGSVMTEAYRTLQHFLQHECKKSVRTINKWEMSSLFKVLCNCRKKLKTEHCVTFLKFVSIAFGLSSVTVSEEQATSLFIALQNHLRTRVGTVQLDRIKDKQRWIRYCNAKKKMKFNRDEYNKFFNKQRELQLLTKYIQTKEVGLTKAHFDNKYPEKKHLFMIDTIKGRITLIIRVLFKRLNIMSQKYKHYGIPTFIRMDGEDVRFMARAADSTLLRLQLLNFFFNTGPLRTVAAKLIQLINNINIYVVMKQNERFGKVIERRQPSSSVIDKVDYNVQLSRDKLKETKRRYQPDQIFLKGKERNYQHFLNFQNGEGLHYYRKVDEEAFKKAIEPEELSLFNHDQDFQKTKREEEEPSGLKKEESMKIRSFEEEDVIEGGGGEQDINAIIMGEINKYLSEYAPENEVEDLTHLKTTTHIESQYEKQMTEYLNRLDLDFQNM